MRSGPGLAATLNPIVALVLPFALLAITSHPLSLDVDHPQPDSVDSDTVSVPPDEPAESVDLLSAYRQGAAACVTWTVCPSTEISAARDCGTALAVTE